MKKILLIASVFGMISLASSCSKCNTCSGASNNVLNHDYCSRIYKTKKSLEEAKVNCELGGGTWSEKE